MSRTMQEIKENWKGWKGTRLSDEKLKEIAEINRLKEEAKTLKAKDKSQKNQADKILSDAKRAAKRLLRKTRRAARKEKRANKLREKGLLSDSLSDDNVSGYTDEQMKLIERPEIGQYAITKDNIQEQQNILSEDADTIKDNEAESSLDQAARDYMKNQAELNKESIEKGYISEGDNAVLSGDNSTLGAEGYAGALDTSEVDSVLSGDNAFNQNSNLLAAASDTYASPSTLGEGGYGAEAAADPNNTTEYVPSATLGEGGYTDESKKLRASTKGQKYLTRDDVRQSKTEQALEAFFKPFQFEYL